jgi:N-acetyl-anhydromuramyl-L-alanine amidase AmpD
MRIANIPLIAGPGRQKPNRIIIHAMGEFIHPPTSMDYHAVEWLRLKTLSAHVFGTPSGAVIRSRKNTEGAWHAKGFNRDSLSYEFLVPGVHDYSSFLEAIKKPYLTVEQYKAGVEFVRDEWVNKLGILRVDRHGSIDPARKHDPGDGFPWLKFLTDIGVTI